MSEKISLQPPYEAISVAIDIQDKYVRFDYFGPADLLIACGAASPDMIRPGKSGKRRFDRYGDPFRRDKRLKAIGIIRFITDTVRARAMPGATGDMLTDNLRQLIANPSRVVVEERTNRHTRFYYGTKEMLIAKGIALAEMFEKKFDNVFQGNYEHGEQDVLWVYRLRDGFFGVEKEGALSSDINELATKYPDMPAKTALLIGSSGAKDFQMRDRPVGRYQRQVQWTTIEQQLIIPNWSKIKTDWMVERAVRNT
jgi:hypothetical protein